MASYPGAPVIFPSRIDGTTVFAAHPNALQDEVSAIEAALLGQLPHELNLGKTLRLTSIIGPPTITADQNDYAPAGLATATWLRLSSDATREITGLAAQPLGRLLLLLNAGSQDIVLPHESALSVAANRWFNAAGLSITLPANAQMWVIYDASQRWRAVGAGGAGASSGGGTQTYTPVWSISGGTAPSLGNGTLTGRFWRVGKLVTYHIRLVAGSTTGFGTAGNAWRFTLPSTPAVADSQGHISFAWLQDAGTSNFLGLTFGIAPNLIGLFPNNSATQVGPTAPFTWVSGDGLTVQGSYWEP